MTEAIFKDEQAFKGEEQETNPEFNLARGQNQLERGLQSRHIQFLALGMISLPLPLLPENIRESDSR